MTGDTPAAAKIADCTSTLRAPGVSHFHKALLLTSRGDAYASLRRYSAAVADFTHAMRLDPRNREDAATRRGIAYEGAGDLDLALRDYTAAIREHARDPANGTNGSADVAAEQHALRGRVLLKLKRPAQAVFEFEMAIATSPTPDLAVIDYPGGVGGEVATLRATAEAQLRKAINGR